jgi:hypothetical protein
MAYDQAFRRPYLHAWEKMSAHHTRVWVNGVLELRWFIDDAGNTRTGTIHDCCYAFLEASSMLPEQFTDYAIRHIGYVDIKSSPSGLSVRWNPAVISARGLAGLLYFVNDKVRTPLLLQTWRGDQWWNTLLSADQQVRMTTVIDLHAAETRQHDPLIMTQTGRADFLESHNTFAALISFWRQWQSQPRRDLNEQDRETIDTLTNGRFVLVVREPHLPRELSVEWLGNGFPDHISTAFQKTLHRSVCNLPDYRYGQAVAQAFERALRSPDAPLYEHVDARVRYLPFERERRVYQRLILRFASPGAEDFLIAASVPSNPQERCVAC